MMLLFTEHNKFRILQTVEVPANPQIFGVEWCGMKHLLSSFMMLFSGVAIAYDLHIENSGKTIEQWNTFIETSGLLMSSPKAEISNPLTGEVISILTPNAAKAESGLYFSPRETKRGLKITISNPSDLDILFLKEIANELGGVLVGDEGEQY